VQHVSATGDEASSRQSSMAPAGAESDGEDTDVRSNYPLRCLVRQFNFTATVTDANGKRCRGQVSTKACFGSCDSYEVGTFEFPWIVRVQPVCNYDGVVMKEIRLSDCDPGVDNGALVYRFPEASSCSCAICDPREQACEASPSKRSIPSMERVYRRKKSTVTEIDAIPVYVDEAQIMPENSNPPRAIVLKPFYDGRMSGWMAWTQMRRRRN